MCKLEEILFDVKKVNTAEIGFGGTQGRDHLVIGDIEGTPIILNLCSENYELIPNSMVFTRIEEMLNEIGVKYTAKYQNKNNTRFYADYRFDVEGLTIGGTDKITPMLKVEHSYDSSRKFNCEFGMFRWVCSNGLSMPFNDEEMKEAGLKNLQMSGKHSFENMERTFGGFVDFVKNQLEGDVFKKVTEKYQIIADTAVTNLSERIEEVISATGVFDKKLTETAVNLANYEAKLLGQGANEWLVYNAINALLYDNSINSKSPEDRAKLDEKVLENVKAKVFTPVA